MDLVILALVTWAVAGGSCCFPCGGSSATAGDSDLLARAMALELRFSPSVPHQAILACIRSVHDAVLWESCWPAYLVAEFASSYRFFGLLSSFSSPLDHSSVLRSLRKMHKSLKNGIADSFVSKILIADRFLDEANAQMAAPSQSRRFRNAVEMAAARLPSLTMTISSGLSLDLLSTNDSSATMVRTALEVRALSISLIRAGPYWLPMVIN